MQWWGTQLQMHFHAINPHLSLWLYDDDDDADDADDDADDADDADDDAGADDEPEQPSQRKAISPPSIESQIIRGR